MRNLGMSNSTGEQVEKTTLCMNIYGNARGNNYGGLWWSKPTIGTRVPSSWKAAILPSTFFTPNKDISYAILFSSVFSYSRWHVGIMWRSWQVISNPKVNLVSCDTRHRNLLSDEYRGVLIPKGSPFFFGGEGKWTWYQVTETTGPILRNNLGSQFPLTESPSHKLISCFRLAIRNFPTLSFSSVLVDSLESFSVSSSSVPSSCSSTSTWNHQGMGLLPREHSTVLTFTTTKKTGVRCYHFSKVYCNELYLVYSSHLFQEHLWSQEHPALQEYQEYHHLQDYPGKKKHVS